MEPFVGTFHRISFCYLACRQGFLLVCLLLTISFVGCEKKSSRRPANVNTVQQSDEQDAETALRLVGQLGSIEEAAAIPDIIYHLNRWIAQQPSDENWVKEPMLERLPSLIREIMPTSDLDEMRFLPNDISHLRESTLARDIGLQVTRQPPRAEFTNWTKEQQPPIEREASELLVIAQQLFDWTITNIQLDPLLPYPPDQAAGPDQNSTASNRPLPAPRRGLPGPGYRLEPWQVLLYGHGDRWQRARAFILLCRQQDIPVVELAIDDVKANKYEPWLPAALIGGKLYLFDVMLGLPIPGPGGVGIATLEQVAAEPALLSNLDLSSEERYPINAESLKNVIALIDASPASLQHRMKLVEAKLSSQNRAVLSVSPSAIADAVRKSGGVKSAAIWPVAWETPLYQTTIFQIAQINPQAVFNEMIEPRFFSQLHPLVRGRYAHLRGELENQEDKKGAKGWYIQARLPDSSLNNLATLPELQKQLGLQRDEREDDESWKNRLQVTRTFWTQSKMCASYWLGLVHMETGKPDVAINWLQERTIEAFPGGLWVNGATYNLARCHEALGKFEAARSLYLTDKSPQEHGNRLRGKRLPKTDAVSKDDSQKPTGG